MNFENTNTTNMPNVQEYITQVNKNDTLVRTNGQLMQTIQYLKDELAKKEEKEPKIKVTHYNTTSSIRPNSFISGAFTARNNTEQVKVEYINFDSAKQLIQKELETKYEKELDELKKLNKRIKLLEEDIVSQRKDYEREIDKLHENYNQQIKDTIEKKQKDINELKDKYNKLKENNTKTATELRRKKEIDKLKFQIDLLTKENNRLTRLSFFGKLFNNKARAAEREFKLKLAELKQNVYTLSYDTEQEEFTSKFSPGITTLTMPYDW